MPIYEYTCQGCGDDFEALVRGGNTPACPSCASSDVDKNLSVFARPPGGGFAAAPADPCGSCGDPQGPSSCPYK